MSYIPVLIPKAEVSHMANEVVNVLSEFEPYHPDPKFSFNGRGVPASNAWPTVLPQTGPPITPIPLLIQKMMKATWTYAEPSWDNTKGAQPGQAAHGITIGLRNRSVPAARGITIGIRDRATDDLGLFTPQQRPTTPKDAAGNIHGYVSTMPNDSAIANDWNLFETIARTNAVTFRGDSRSPNEVIFKADGFFPPNSRKDRYYLENDVYNAFADYLMRRWGREITQKKFLEAVDGTAVVWEDKKLLIDYMNWRKITEKEAAHLGRMVETERLKGYISTARAIDTSLNFATNFGKRDGWLYLTVVHSGFVVPLGEQFWGTEEGEIAQWGPIPSKRIVAFVRVLRTRTHPAGRPDGPIFIRTRFRFTEPKAFEQMFKVMSGMVPTQMV